jgi:hypothetical protein
MKKILIAAGAVLVLGACTTMPTGPSVMVLPGTGKNFDQFRFDDAECRNFASAQVGGTSPDGASESSGVKSAAVGTAVGAAAGALIGGRSGAATGAGVGLIAGSATGAGAAGYSQRSLQQRYDVGYQQCMYAKGHRVPVAGRFEATRPAPAGSSYAPPPPPPPGTPPPPPPGVTR